MLFASDEFYAMSGRALPNYDAYEGFPQLENGVGLMRSFEYEVEEELSSVREKISVGKKNM